MKWSRFNVLFKSSHNEYFIYNSYTNCFLKISQPFYNQLKTLEEAPDCLQELSPEDREYLTARKILVGPFDDDNVVLQMRLLKYKRCFINSELNLVVAPTLACNFACPYCYEKNLPSDVMSEEKEDELIEFVKRYEQRSKGINLCWHGGEPLIAFRNIRSILQKLKERCSLPLLQHDMVTNGFLFTPEMCDFFNEYKLNFVQITIDGSREIHNCNRVHKSGQPTYDVILHNIDMLVEKMPACRIIVRVNIHNGNKEDFPVIYKELSARWKGANLFIRPAMVQGENSGCSVSCLSSHEKARFFIDMYEKEGMKIDFTPAVELGSCTACLNDSFVIDPEGMLYKCWSDIGLKDWVVGDVKEGVSKWKIVSEYMINSDKFADPKCLECKIFPICKGGCNRFRIEYKYHQEPYDVCPVGEHGLDKYLEIIYEQQKGAVAH